MEALAVHKPRSDDKKGKQINCHLLLCIVLGTHTAASLSVTGVHCLPCVKPIHGFPTSKTMII